MKNCLEYHRGGRRVIKRLPPEFWYNQQGFIHQDTKTRRCTKESGVFVNLVTLCRRGQGSGSFELGIAHLGQGVADGPGTP
jgi:hypothetical protein